MFQIYTVDEMVEDIGLWEDNHIVATQGVVVGSEDCEDQMVVRLVVQYILDAPVVVFVDMESTSTGVPEEEYPAIRVQIEALDTVLF